MLVTEILLDALHDEARVRLGHQPSNLIICPNVVDSPHDAYFDSSYQQTPDTIRKPYTIGINSQQVYVRRSYPPTLTTNPLVGVPTIFFELYDPDLVAKIWRTIEDVAKDWRDGLKKA